MTVREFLEAHETIGIDTMVFIYHFEDHPFYAPITHEILSACEEGTVQGVTSVITLLEITVKPKREGKDRVAREYVELLTTFPHLTIVEIDLAVVELAAELRAKYDIRTPDALQLAAALREKATAFVINDKRLTRVKELPVMTLDGFVGAHPHDP